LRAGSHPRAPDALGPWPSRVSRTERHRITGGDNNPRGKS
jgi:hypothetical protein